MSMALKEIQRFKCTVSTNALKLILFLLREKERTVGEKKSGVR